MNKYIDIIKGKSKPLGSISPDKKYIKTAKGWERRKVTQTTVSNYLKDIGIDSLDHNYLYKFIKNKERREAVIDKMGKLGDGVNNIIYRLLSLPDKDLKSRMYHLANQFEYYVENKKSEKKQKVIEAKKRKEANLIVKQILAKNLPKKISDIESLGIGRVDKKKVIELAKDYNNSNKIFDRIIYKDHKSTIKSLLLTLNRLVKKGEEGSARGEAIISKLTKDLNAYNDIIERRGQVLGRKGSKEYNLNVNSFDSIAETKQMYEMAKLCNEKGEVFYQKKGEKHHVGFTEKEILILKSGAVKNFIHNHPSGQSFSIPDVLFALKYGIPIFAVKGAADKGGVYRYCLYPPKIADQDKLHDVLYNLNDIIKKHNEITRDVFNTAIDDGKMTTNEAGEKHWDRVMKRSVEDWNMEYPSNKMKYEYKKII